MKIRLGYACISNIIETTSSKTTTLTYYKKLDTNTKQKKLETIIKENLNNLVLRLSSVSPAAVLNRGYAWIKDEKGQTVYNVKDANQTNELEINFADGAIKAKPITTTRIYSSKTTKKVHKDHEQQISLFDF